MSQSRAGVVTPDFLRFSRDDAGAPDFSAKCPDFLMLATYSIFFKHPRPNKTHLWTGCSPQAQASKFQFIGTGMFSLEKKNLRRDIVLASNI